MLLTGKKTLVTGAGGALGQAVVTAARRENANLILVDALEIKGQPEDTVVKLDLTDRAATQAAFAKMGGIDAVFHLAGGFSMGSPSYAVPDEDWTAMFDINVKTLRNLMAAIIPNMIERKRGSVVTVGANSALRGLPLMGAYCAAKASVMRLTESLSAELKTKGINVNAVLPTIIDTPKNRADMPETDPALWVSPGDLANVICFLGSDRAKAIHGALIPVVGML